MVRGARRGDASRVAEILVFVKRASYRCIFKNDAVSFGDMQVLPLAKAFIDDDAALDGYYVYDDGIVKGVLQLCPYNGDIKALEIVQLYVESCFQGQGVGNALIGFALNEAERLKADNVFLWVLEKNFKARAFYERCGFAFTGEKKPEEGTPETLMRYELRLAA